MSWFLLGASPDLRTQIEANPDLHPQQGTRSTPICGVLLTCCELDHVTGLLHLREFQLFNVYATPSVISVLRDQNSMFRMLNRVPKQVCWQSLRPGQEFRLKLPVGQECGIQCQPVALSDQLVRVQGSAQRAREMGHIPVGGEDGSLCQLRGIRAGRKLYIHINNTNPMLNEAGPEYRAMRDAGWELAEDGWQVTL